MNVVVEERTSGKEGAAFFRVRTLWVASVCGGVRRVRRPPALWSNRGAGVRMQITPGVESA